MNTTSSPTPNAIAKLAYQLWENAGRPEGRAEEFWYEAERHLRAAAVAATAVLPRSPATESTPAATPLAAAPRTAAPTIAAPTLPAAPTPAPRRKKRSKPSPQ